MDLPLFALIGFAEPEAHPCYRFTEANAGAGRPSIVLDLAVLERKDLLPLWLDSSMTWSYRAHLVFRSVGQDYTCYGTSSSISNGRWRLYTSKLFRYGKCRPFDFLDILDYCVIKGLGVAANSVKPYV